MRVTWQPLVVSVALPQAIGSKICIFFFLSAFSFTDTDDSRDSRGREGTVFYSTLPLLHAHEHSDFATFATLHVRWLSHIFNRVTCIYQAATQWDLPPYRITIWLIDDVTLNFCLFTWWFDSSFFVTAIWDGKPVHSNSHQLSPLYYKANGLTKCASHLHLSFGISIKKALMKLNGTYIMTCWTNWKNFEKDQKSFGTACS